MRPSNLGLRSGGLYCVREGMRSLLGFRSMSPSLSKCCSSLRHRGEGLRTWLQRTGDRQVLLRAENWRKSSPRRLLREPRLTGLLRLGNMIFRRVIVAGDGWKKSSESSLYSWMEGRVFSEAVAQFWRWGWPGEKKESNGSGRRRTCRLVAYLTLNSSLTLAGFIEHVQTICRYSKDCICLDTIEWLNMKYYLNISQVGYFLTQYTNQKNDYLFWMIRTQLLWI